MWCILSIETRSCSLNLASGQIAATVIAIIYSKCAININVSINFRAGWQKYVKAMILLSTIMINTSSPSSLTDKQVAELSPEADRIDVGIYLADDFSRLCRIGGQ